MFSVLKKLSWFFKRHWKRYTSAIILLTIAGVIEVIPPKLVGVAIDEIHQNKLTSERLFELLLFYGGLIVVIYGITYVWMYQLFGGAFLVERAMRSQFMRHLIKMTPTFYERNRTGDLMARATNDLKAISIKKADQILVLDHGEIVERGDHKNLMEMRGKYYQMYQLQQGQKESAAV
jgi:ATP-binding cassette subfamily B multidrug efflux pump